MKKTKKTKIMCGICLGLLLLILIVIGISKLFESIVFQNRDYNPMCQPNTVWKCSNPNIMFSVDGSKCFGKYENDSKTINVKVIFDKGNGTGITINDYDAIESKTVKYATEARIFKGQCKFNKSKFEVKVTKSNVDNIKVGDKITFVKQES